MTIQLRHHDRICTACNGTGFVTYEPVNPGGPRVSDACTCQPIPVETDREYWHRLGAQDAAAQDAAMDQADDWFDVFKQSRRAPE